MKNIDPLDKISEKNLEFNLNECIFFLQKSNDVKEVRLTQHENEKLIVQCITYSDSDDLISIDISPEFKDMEEILDFFQKIIQYNISIVAISIDFNGILEDFEDKDKYRELFLSMPEFKEMFSNVKSSPKTHIDQDKKDPQTQKREEIKKQLKINEFFVELHAPLYRRKVSYYQDENTRRNKKPKITVNSNIFKDVIFFQRKKIRRKRKTFTKLINFYFF